MALSQTEKITILLLVILSAVCVILALTPLVAGDILAFIFAFPYAQLGVGLRGLSLSGTAGNIISIILYITICLVPLAVLMLSRKFYAESALLSVISIALFIIMFHLINPGRTPIGDALHIERAMLGGTAHSLVLAYFSMGVLRRFSSASTLDLGRYIGIALYILAAIFVVVAFGLMISQTQAAMEAVQAGNHDMMFGFGPSSPRLGTTYAFLLLRYVTNALPYVLNIWVVLVAMRLLGAMQAHQYSQDAVRQAQNLAQACRRVFGITVFTSAGFHMLQLLAMHRLHDINNNVNVPITPILFVLGALLLARYIAAGKEIKDENEAFI